MDNNQNDTQIRITIEFVSAAMTLVYLIHCLSYTMFILYNVYLIQSLVIMTETYKNSCHTKTSHSNKNLSLMIRIYCTGLQLHHGLIALFSDRYFSSKSLSLVAILCALPVLGLSDVVCSFVLASLAVIVSHHCTQITGMDTDYIRWCNLHLMSVQCTNLY